MGILGPLSKRVGAEGKVVGVDLDPKQLDAARAYVEQEGLKNVDVLQRDAYNTGLPRASFDFVHARFILAPLGRDNDLLREMSALTRPGGIMASEEPDGSSWNCYAPNINWDTLKNAIIHIFSLGGGDFNAGRKTYALLRQAGLEDVRIRAVVLPLESGHPYTRLPIQLATSLRQRILDAGLLTEVELDYAIDECERILKDPDTCVITYALIQVWGRKPNANKQAKQ
jgi:hypothetical protein